MESLWNVLSNIPLRRIASASLNALTKGGDRSNRRGTSDVDSITKVLKIGKNESRRNSVTRRGDSDHYSGKEFAMNKPRISKVLECVPPRNPLVILKKELGQGSVSEARELGAAIRTALRSRNLVYKVRRSDYKCFYNHNLKQLNRLSVEKELPRDYELPTDEATMQIYKSFTGSKVFPPNSGSRQRTENPGTRFVKMPNPDNATNVCSAISSAQSSRIQSECTYDIMDPDVTQPFMKILRGGELKGSNLTIKETIIDGKATNTKESEEEGLSDNMSPEWLTGKNTYGSETKITALSGFAVSNPMVSQNSDTIVESKNSSSMDGKHSVKTCVTSKLPSDREPETQTVDEPVGMRDSHDSSISREAHLHKKKSVHFSLDGESLNGIGIHESNGVPPCPVSTRLLQTKPTESGLLPSNSDMISSQSNSGTSNSQFFEKSGNVGGAYLSDKKDEPLFEVTAVTNAAASVRTSSTERFNTSLRSDFTGRASIDMSATADSSDTVDLRQKSEAKGSTDHHNIGSSFSNSSGGLFASPKDPVVENAEERYSNSTIFGIPNTAADKHSSGLGFCKTDMRNDQTLKEESAKNQPIFAFDFHDKSPTPNVVSSESSGNRGLFASRSNDGSASHDFVGDFAKNSSFNSKASVGLSNGSASQGWSTQGVFGSGVGKPTTLAPSEPPNGEPVLTTSKFGGSVPPDKQPLAEAPSTNDRPTLFGGFGRTNNEVGGGTNTKPSLFGGLGTLPKENTSKIPTGSSNDTVIGASTFTAFRGIPFQKNTAAGADPSNPADDKVITSSLGSTVPASHALGPALEEGSSLRTPGNGLFGSQEQKENNSGPPQTSSFGIFGKPNTAPKSGGFTGFSSFSAPSTDQGTKEAGEEVKTNVFGVKRSVASDLASSNSASLMFGSTPSMLSNKSHSLLPCADSSAFNSTTTPTSSHFGFAANAFSTTQPAAVGTVPFGSANAQPSIIPQAKFSGPPDFGSLSQPSATSFGVDTQQPPIGMSTGFQHHGLPPNAFSLQSQAQFQQSSAPIRDEYSGPDGKRTRNECIVTDHNMKRGACMGGFGMNSVHFNNQELPLQPTVTTTGYGIGSSQQEELERSFGNQHATQEATNNFLAQSAFSNPVSSMSASEMFGNPSTHKRLRIKRKLNR